MKASLLKTRDSVLIMIDAPRGAALAHRSPVGEYFMMTRVSVMGHLRNDPKLRETLEVAASLSKPRKIKKVIEGHLGEVHWTKPDELELWKFGFDDMGDVIRCLRE